MSAIEWKGNSLRQRVGYHHEELGYVAFDQISKSYVLWLKDICDVFDTNRGYIRGDEFSSMAEAKQNGALSMSARLFHYMWMVNVRKESKQDRKDERKVELEVADRIEKLQSGKPLTEDSMRKIMRKDRKYQFLNMIFGGVVTLFIEHTLFWLGCLTSTFL